MTIQSFAGVVSIGSLYLRRLPLIDTMKKITKERKGRWSCLLALLLLATTSFGISNGDVKEKSAYAEDYQFITQNGGWCWFSDPRAIYVNNKVVGGYVDDEGSIFAFAYEPITQQTQRVKVYDKLQYDDHAHPSVMEMEDGRIAIFFSKHGGHGLPLYYKISKNPGDITSWGRNCKKSIR